MECESELDVDCSLPAPAAAAQPPVPAEDESRTVANAHTLKVKDSNKQNDFSQQFLNFLNTQEEEHIKDITDDDVPNKVDDDEDEVEHKKEINENKKVETKVVGKKQ